MLEKCVLTILQLNWNQRFGDKNTTLKICHHMPMHVVHTTAKQIISPRRKNENIFKISKNACKSTVFHCHACKFVNGFCCRRRVAQPPPDSTQRHANMSMRRILDYEKIASGIANSSRAAIIMRGLSDINEGSFVDVCLEDCEPIRWSQWERGFKVGLSCNDSNKKLWLIANSTRRELTRIRM